MSRFDNEVRVAPIKRTYPAQASNLKARIDAHIRGGAVREEKALKEALRRDLHLFRLMLRVLEHGL